MSILNKYKYVHFVGIGGIGISAVADMFLQVGAKVSGSDVVDSKILVSLRKHGANVFIGDHKKENVPVKTELLIYSTAVPSNNPEFIIARKRGITRLSYPESIGKLMKGKLGIAVSGSHGKTTTTAMVGHLFIEAGLDPSIIVGSKIKILGNMNARLGKGRYLIVEGDEYKEAFLAYKPKAIVLTNIEEDHLDYYRDLGHIIEAFAKYVRALPQNGILVANHEDRNIQSVLPKARCRVITYGFGNSDYIIKNIVLRQKTSFCTLVGKHTLNIKLRIPGLHNLMNASAAACLGLSLGIKPRVIERALQMYQGAWRRFELKGVRQGITILDDYAHHPTEIAVTLATARKRFPGKKIWCVFQPHSRNRTLKLFQQFQNAFRDVDKLILAEIYDVAGRERGEQISSLELARAIERRGQEVTLIPKLSDIVPYITRNAKKGDVIIAMGAGDIAEVSSKLLKSLK